MAATARGALLEETRTYGPVNVTFNRIGRELTATINVPEGYVANVTVRAEVFRLGIPARKTVVKTYTLPPGVHTLTISASQLGGVWGFYDISVNAEKAGPGEEQQLIEAVTKAFQEQAKMMAKALQQMQESIQRMQEEMAKGVTASQEALLRQIQALQEQMLQLQKQILQLESQPKTPEQEKELEEMKKELEALRRELQQLQQPAPAPAPAAPPTEAAAPAPTAPAPTQPPASKTSPAPSGPAPGRPKPSTAPATRPPPVQRMMLDFKPYKYEYQVGEPIKGDMTVRIVPEKQLSGEASLYALVTARVCTSSGCRDYPLRGLSYDGPIQDLMRGVEVVLPGINKPGRVILKIRTTKARYCEGGVCWDLEGGEVVRQIAVGQVQAKPATTTTTAKPAPAPAKPAQPAKSPAKPKPQPRPAPAAPTPSKKPEVTAKPGATKEVRRGSVVAYLRRVGPAKAMLIVKNTTGDTVSVGYGVYSPDGRRVGGGSVLLAPGEEADLPISFPEEPGTYKVHVVAGAGGRKLLDRTFTFTVTVTAKPKTTGKAKPIVKSPVKTVKEKEETAKKPALKPTPAKTKPVGTVRFRRISYSNNVLRVEVVNETNEPVFVSYRVEPLSGAAPPRPPRPTSPVAMALFRVFAQTVVVPPGGRQVVMVNLNTKPPGVYVVEFTAKAGERVWRHREQVTVRAVTTQSRRPGPVSAAMELYGLRVVDHGGRRTHIY